jgi:AcrR family transcriptional regulator
MTPHPTRLALTAAAMRRFGRDGFEAASTRDIAAEAGTNVSSIAYHFGGKDGLRLACADAVAERIGRIARPLPGDPALLGKAQARAVLRRLVHRIVTFLIATAEAQDTVSFLLRELAQPGSPVLDRLYSTLIEPRHRALCGVWAAATGREADSVDVRLAVFSIIGQAAYFRLAAPIVQRRMGWSGYPPEAASAIARRLLANLDAMLEAPHG